MSLIDLIWNFSQEGAIDELKTEHDLTKDVAKRDRAVVVRLRQENRELQLRVGILIRILIDRGIFSAADYSALLEQTKQKLAQSDSQGDPK